MIDKNDFHHEYFVDLGWIVLPPHLSPFVEEKEGDYVPPERLGQRQAENDVEEQPTSSVPSINLVENNAYLNGNIKRKRTDNEETPKPTSKEERVRTDSIFDWIEDWISCRNEQCALNLVKYKISMSRVLSNVKLMKNDVYEK